MDNTWSIKKHPRAHSTQLWNGHKNGPQLTIFDPTYTANSQLWMKTWQSLRMEVFDEMVWRTELWDLQYIYYTFIETTYQIQNAYVWQLMLV